MGQPHVLFGINWVAAIGAVAATGTFPPVWDRIQRAQPIFRRRTFRVFFWAFILALGVFPGAIIAVGPSFAAQMGIGMAMALAALGVLVLLYASGIAALFKSVPWCLAQGLRGMAWVLERGPVLRKLWFGLWLARLFRVLAYLLCDEGQD